MGSSQQSLSIRNQVEESCKSKHQELLSGLTNAERWSKEADLGVGNQVVASTHGNRTILELVQNARDTIRDGSTDGGSVSVIVAPDSLLIANTGRRFRLDDEEVFKAVTQLGRSAKVRERESIGEKGVGLKSILRLSEAFSIESKVDGDRISAEFSRAKTAKMVLAIYQKLLENGDVTNIVEHSADVEAIEACENLLDAVCNDFESLSLIPPYVDIEPIERQLEADGGDSPPGLLELFSDLPRLSLFRYPFIKSNEANTESEISNLSDRLLQLDESEPADQLSIDDQLNDWLGNRSGQFETVVSLDYTEAEWSSLLDEIQRSLNDIDAAVADRFAEIRQSPSGDELEQFNADRQEEFWEECKALSAETLVLLGHIQEIDFVKVDRTEDGELELADYRKVSVQADDLQTIDEANEFAHKSVNVEEVKSYGHVDPPHSEEFRLYSRHFELPEALQESEPAEDADEDNDPESVRLLLEQPRPDDEEWAPSIKPMYLYYPIEEERTPFSFVMHAPFEVSFNRQHLDEGSEKNSAILEQIPDFVADVATHLVGFGSTGPERDGTSYRPWLPWLLMPLAEFDDRTSEIVHDTITQVTETLQETPIVPTDDSTPRTPTEILLDPDRLEAFEPLRVEEDSSPIAARSVIINGQAWQTNASDAGLLEGERFGEQSARLGLTTVIDQLFDNEDDGTRGLIDILCEFWGIDPANDDAIEIDWAKRVEDERHAIEYFEAIGSALRQASPEGEGDPIDDATVNEAATQLGEYRVPLLPAEAHDESVDESSEGPQLTHLVRAKAQDRGGGSRRYQRSERIVFRRVADDDSQQRKIKRLPTPLNQLRVYIIPFKPGWSGWLDNFNRTWGTRKLESPAEFYRRVAAEAGGFSTDPEFDLEVLGYLLRSYRETSSGRVAEWLYPEPYLHRAFDDVDKLLQDNYFRSTPDDYDDLLERRYAQQVPLPSDTGEGACEPAESMVFGTGWANVFYKAAEQLETNDGLSDPFDRGDEEANPRIARLRRWGRAIECIAETDIERATEVAPPDNPRWRELLQHADLPEGDRGLWLLNFPLHLGVQVGPHVSWAWLFPQREDRDRRAGVLSVQEAKSLSNGDPELGTDSPIDPPTELIQKYTRVSWRSENHPAFSAGHSGNQSKGCQSNWLNCDPESWIDNDGAAIPTWWYFTELEALADEDLEKFRTAVLLLWPELSKSIGRTAWYCSNHQLRSPNSKIPSLGLVQLSRTPMWPVEPIDPTESDAEGLIEIEKGTRFPTDQLILSTDDRVRGAPLYLPRLDLDTLRSTILTTSAKADWAEIDIELPAVADALGVKSIDDLTPSEGADRLEWYLSNWMALSVSSEGAESLDNIDSSISLQSLRVPVYGLMRQLVNAGAIQGKRAERDEQLPWLRRDIWHTGTRLLLTHGGNPYSFQIGKDGPGRGEIALELYSQNLPQYARTRLEMDELVAIVERPQQEARLLTSVLGQSAEEESSTEFGIVGKTEIPPLLAAHGNDQAIDDEASEIDQLRRTLQDKIEYLLAGYYEQSNSPEVEETYQTLSSVISNPIGIVENDDGARRRSAEWKPDHDEGVRGKQIAIFRTALETHRDSPDEIPAYLAADGLAQVIDQYDLRETFESILIKDEAALRYDYGETLRDVQAHVDDLRVKRLNRVIAALDALVAMINDGIETPSGPVEELDPESTIHAFRNARSVNGENRLLVDWKHCLQNETGFTAEAAALAIEAAAAEEATDRQRLMVEVGQSVPSLVLEELAKSDPRWNELNVWPASGSPSQLRPYVTAVTRLREFWAALTESEDPDEDDINEAVLSARTSIALPKPLDNVDTVLPYSSRLPPTHQAQPLVLLAYQGGDHIPKAVSNAVQDWWDDCVAELEASDVVFQDEEFVELLGQLGDAITDPDTADPAVKDAFEIYQSTSGKLTSRARKAQHRTEKTNEWVSNEDADIETISSTLSEGNSPTSGGSPDISDRTGVSRDHPNAEIDDERGRDAELICLGRSWNQFRQCSHADRAAILELLTEWRSFDGWRMNSVDDVAENTTAVALEKVRSGEALLDILREEDISNSDRERAVFHALFDVSSERGPGFDLIDPFATAEDVSNDDYQWQPDQMRRLEVKAIAAEHSSRGRIGLTGNEFRMARRPRPDHSTSSATGGVGDGTVYQYLLRIVVLPMEWWDETTRNDAVSLWDVEDLVEFAGFDSPEVPIWEKLRGGGKFYVNFGFEE
jgi:hypothetical protein